MKTIAVKAYGAQAADQELELLTIDRRELQPDDVQVEILYCGVCHSDIHYVRNHWGGAHYPAVPGHEIVGRVLIVGAKVTQFKVGDVVGVGVIVDSCQACTACQEGAEQYCDRYPIKTYGSPDHYTGGYTYGGYAQEIVVREKFVFRIPKNLDIKRVGPLLCAGITTYSPLKEWKVQPGDKVGVIGLGGLGHMGIKLAKAMGAEVTMITRSPEKLQDAKILGADHVLLSTDPGAMKAKNKTFDFLLNTIPVNHDLNPYLRLLKYNCTMVLVGAIEPLNSVDGSLLIRLGRRLAGSMIGGIAETQEMLDFCGKHQVLPEVELIPIQEINKAWKRVEKGTVKYRFVIDMQSLKK